MASRLDRIAAILLESDAVQPDDGEGPPNLYAATDPTLWPGHEAWFRARTPRPSRGARKTSRAAAVRVPGRASAAEWRRLRVTIYTRDGGKCRVCGLPVPKGEFEAGHIVDRCAGGTDSVENVSVMCGYCNRLKPVHDSVAAFERWRAEWRKTVCDLVRATLYGPPRKSKARQ